VDEKVQAESLDSGKRPRPFNFMENGENFPENFLEILP
jgi:hypothetical protein